ncbi:MAG: translation initiation factor IF-2 [Simkaniaceae bacterium]
MAKNLKLKVKNTQLAKALKINKDDKEPEKKDSKSPDEDNQAKKPVRAKAKTLTPISMKTDTPEKKDEKPTQVPPPIQEKKPDLEPKAPLIDEKKTEAKEEKEDTSSTPAKKDKKPKPALKKPPAKEYKDFKGGPRRFSSRDSRGLSRSDDGSWKRRRGGKAQGRSRAQEEIDRPKSLKVKLPITLRELASQMKLKASELISKLFMQGMALTLNDYLDDETTVQLLGQEFGCEISIDTSEEKRLQITSETIEEEIKSSKAENLKVRSPVIAFMGHVDHGKTSLIDAIRKSNLASKEAGAITQHIGAFRCSLDNGHITILDTPGHEAFSAMRERGALATDLVILVIAGDEGIKPQTDEAINQAKAADVPIIVAINKNDKPNFNADEIYRQLSERELLPEAWGGATITINCSAHTGDGISDLLEMVLLQAELLELKANPKARARGTILESELHKGLGAAATLLVQNGTLECGNALVIDQHYGRVKTMHDEHGKSVQSAPPSTPVKITGISGVPKAGAEFIVVDSEKEARKIVQERAAGREREVMRRPKARALEELMLKEQERQQKKTLPIILKADVQGSLQALKASLKKIPSKKAELTIVSEGVGEISESDIELAHASNAVIFGFHTQVETHAEESIRKRKVVVKTHDIIYHLIDDVKLMMRELLDKIRQEREIGEARVQAIFKSSQLGLIAGCIVTDGLIKKSSFVKLLRGNQIIWSGDLLSLKRVKEDAKEVKKDFECGLLLKNFQDVHVGDIVKAFDVTFIEQDL